MAWAMAVVVAEEKVSRCRVGQCPHCTCTDTCILLRALRSSLTRSKSLNYVDRSTW